MNDLIWLTLIVGLFVGLVTQCTRPERARCPDGYDVRAGIRRSGDFECWPRPVGDPDYDGTYGKPERGTQSDAIIRGRIYCTGGTQPIVVDYLTVGCQR